MEGMLSPEFKEEITSTVEVLETFKITKVGTIAGCIVRDERTTSFFKSTRDSGWYGDLHRRTGILETFQG